MKQFINLIILPIFLLVFFVSPVHAQSLKLYLAGSGSDPDLSETQPSGNTYQTTVWNGTYVKTFDNYYLTEDINGNDYTFSLLCASTATRDFTAVIKIGGQQVASTSFTVSGITYTLYSIPVTGVDPTISTSSEVVLDVTINGSGGATSGILWGNTGAPFAHILIPPAGPPVLDPPQNLAVQAINDSIILNWDPPGGGGTIEELIYDNGVTNTYYAWNGNTMATHMSPSGPCKILRLKYYTLIHAGNNTFNAEIYNWEGSQPGTSLIFSAPVTAVNASWLELDISSQNITYSDDFVVGFGSINETTFLGYDANHNNGRSFDFDGSNWSAWSEAYFIRAIVEYTTGEVAELSPVTYSLVNEHAGSKTVKISNKRFNQNKKIKAVAFLSEDISHEYSPLGLIGYNVYRYGNLITTVPSNQTTFTDTNLMPGTYCYTITGLYDEGESDSTNRECATIAEPLGPQFRAFVNRVNSVPVPEKQAIIDSFMNAAPSFPFIEENTIVYYIYQGGVGSATVPGDANNWDISAFPMTQLDGTIFWYREAVFESDARLDYKFGLNGINWILDPLNPNQVSGEFGPNSELAMPDYVQPLEIEYYPNIPHGTLTPFPFTSDTLGNTRTISVYTPPGYDSHPTYSYPVMLFHDGARYDTLGSAVNILDYLLSENKMNPIIAVFVPPVNRDNEYAFSQTQQFESFIIDELMPHIDATYRTHTTPDKRAMAGARFGGLITTQICYNRPESFGLSAPYSPSYWAKNMEVFNSVLNGPQKDIDWYLDWGTYEYEPSITVNARSMRDTLISKNYDIMWNEWHEGTSWGSWRAHLDIALEYFFPKTVDVSDEKSFPEEYFLSQNFPNPFNPATTIRYEIKELTDVELKVFDILGRELMSLINEEKPAGRYEAKFDATALPSGVYFYRLQAGSFVETKKMVLMK